MLVSNGSITPMLWAQADVLYTHIIVLAWLEVSLFFHCPSLFLCYLRFLLHHFSFVFLSHLFPLANAQQHRVCGLQPIQPPCLQQLQTWREPKQQQSGNGMNIDTN